MKPTVLLATICVCSSIADAAEDPKAQFEELFGDRVTRARASADRGDDIALAELLLEMGGELEEQKELKVLMYEEACRLALQDTAGHPLVLDAVKRLATLAPQRRADWRAYRLSSFRARYTGSGGKKRVAAGSKYIAELVAAGDALAASGDAAGAEAMYRQALPVAVAINSDRRDDIRDKIRNLSEEIRKNKALDTYRKRLQDDPGDTAAREALILIHLLEYDDAAGARKLLAKGVDPTLGKHVTGASMALADLDADGCLKMADWYESLAQSQDTDLRKAVAYRRAGDYLAAYRQKHGKKDMASLKAKIRQAAIEKKRAALDVDLPKRRTLRPGATPAAKKKKTVANEGGKGGAVLFSTAADVVATLEQRGSVQVGAGGRMIIEQGAFIAPRETARAITKQCMATNELTVAAVVTPADADHAGPARIVSLSTDGHHRNFTLGQEKDRFIFRLRTTETGPNGTSPQVTLCPLTPGKPHAIVVTYRPGTLTCRLNGKVVLKTSKVTGDFSNWSEKQVLLFGDEYAEHRYWKGTIKNVRIGGTAGR